jgi:sugar phosphate isomerase/epimerase
VTELPLAVQLYTLRDQVAADFAAVAREVAEMGYSGVELAGYGNLASAAEAKRAVDDAGLKVAGVHVSLEELESDLDRVLQDQHTLNTSTLVCPWLPEDRRRDASAWRRVAGDLNRIALACNERGLEFCYHHHSFEFDPVEGTSGMRLLLENTDPALVKFELDVYWLRHGEEEPVQFIEKLGGRVPLIHLKDMAAGPERKFAAVGEGVMDFPKILQAAERAGVRWGIVEQDDCYGRSPIQAVRSSLKYLQSLRNG